MLYDVFLHVYVLLSMAYSTGTFKYSYYTIEVFYGTNHVSDHSDSNVVPLARLYASHASTILHWAINFCGD